jgi:hypothetical protein
MVHREYLPKGPSPSSLVRQIIHTGGKGSHGVVKSKPQDQCGKKKTIQTVLVRGEGKGGAKAEKSRLLGREFVRRNGDNQGAYLQS